MKINGVSLGMLSITTIPVAGCLLFPLTNVPGLSPYGSNALYPLWGRAHDHCETLCWYCKFDHPDARFYTVDTGTMEPWLCSDEAGSNKRRTSEEGGGLYRKLAEILSVANSPPN